MQSSEFVRILEMASNTLGPLQAKAVITALRQANVDDVADQLEAAIGPLVPTDVVLVFACSRDDVARAMAGVDVVHAELVMTDQRGLRPVIDVL